MESTGSADGFDIFLLLEDQRVVFGVAVGLLTVLWMISSILGGKKKVAVDPDELAQDIIGADRSLTTKKATGKSKSKSKKKKKKSVAASVEVAAEIESEPAPIPATPATTTKAKVIAETNGSKVNGSSGVEIETAKGGKKKKRNRKNKNKKNQDGSANKENEPVRSTPAKDEDSDDEDEFDQAARLLGLRKKKTANVQLTHMVNSKKAAAYEEKISEEADSKKSTSTEKSSNKSKAKEEIAADPNIIIAIGSDPALIIGPGGAIIQNIENASGAKLDILKHTPEPNKHSVRITSPSEQSVTIAMEMVQAIVDAEEKRIANLKSVTLGPKDIKGPDGVKAIIGRGGQTIKDIQQKCGEGLKIDANVESGTVTISGPKEKVDEALILCKNAVFGEAQDTIDLKSRAGVSIVFGKDFSTIRDIQNSTGAKLDIEKGTTVLKFSGKKEQVDAAKTAVTNLLEFNSGVSMNIKSSDIGAVYGKSGANIRSIQDRTGAYIDVDQPKGSNSASVNIMGEPTAVEEARKLIQKAIDGEIELKPGEILETMQLGVATPAVIGRAGTRVKELEREHGVKINVNSESGICRIVGKSPAVKSAKSAIEVIMEPLLMEEAAKKEAEKILQAGDSTWSAPTNGEDELDGW